MSTNRTLGGGSSQQLTNPTPERYKIYDDTCEIQFYFRKLGQWWDEEELYKRTNGRTATVLAALDDTYSVFCCHSLSSSLIISFHIIILGFSFLRCNSSCRSWPALTETFIVYRPCGYLSADYNPENVNNTAQMWQGKTKIHRKTQVGQIGKTKSKFSFADIKFNLFIYLWTRHSYTSLPHLLYLRHDQNGEREW